MAKEIYVKKVKKSKTEGVQILKNLIFLIIAVFPFAWYFALQNHSYIHSFFTNRILVITILNIQIALTMFIGLQDSIMKKDD